MKKLFNLFLCLFFIFNSVQAADFSGGSGTSKDPYQIKSAGDLFHIENYMGSHFILMNDIDLDTTIYSKSKAGWFPIGFEQEPFTGSLDGQNHEIKGVYIHKDIDGAGLFSTLSDATISNLKLSSVSIDGWNWIGGLCGSARKSNLRNIHVDGVLEGDFLIGGIGGELNECEISNCHFRNKIIGSNNLGGLTGHVNSSTIDSCSCNATFTGGVFDANGIIGGLVGEAESATISRSYYKGSLEGTEKVGGIIGSMKNSSIIQCYAIMNIGGTKRTGGICGYMEGRESTITNCYASGRVVSRNTKNVSKNGGIIGEIQYELFGTIDKCYYNGSLSGVKDNSFGEPLTSSEMQNYTSFKGWDFIYETDNGTENIWAYDNEYNSHLPFLSWEKEILDSIVVLTKDISEVTLNSAKLTAELVVIDSVEVKRYGFCHSNRNTVNLEDNVIDLGTSNSCIEFSAILDSLEENTKYSYKAFAVTDQDTIYGGLKFFTTKNNTQPTVVVFTKDTLEVTLNSAKLAAELRMSAPVDIKSYGFCYNAGRTVSLDDHVVGLGSAKADLKFNGTLNSLDVNTIYLYQAFAITAQDTIYGTIKYFRTKEDIYDSVNNKCNYQGVTISPNPVIDQFLIHGVNGECEVQVYSMDGKLVLHKMLTGQLEANASTLNSGIYLLRIKSDKIDEVIKLVKH